jgi:ABC-type nitrate/sulfonate/bicarbonate transport system substrate-binding protein
MTKSQFCLKASITFNFISIIRHFISLNTLSVPMVLAEEVGLVDKEGLKTEIKTRNKEHIAD